MKKLLLLLAFVASCITTTFAQNSPDDATTKVSIDAIRPYSTIRAVPAKQMADLIEALRTTKASAEQYITLTSTYTLTSQTALQALFNTSTTGGLTVPTTASGVTYYFEGEFDLSSMSAVSGDVQFGMGGTATITSIKYTAIATKAALATPSAAQITTGTVATAQSLVTATTNTVCHVRISGIVRVAAGASGTLIPQVGMSVAAPAVVGVNSYFRFVPLGTASTLVVGNWN